MGQKKMEGKGGSELDTLGQSYGISKKRRGLQQKTPSWKLRGNSKGKNALPGWGPEFTNKRKSVRDVTFGRNGKKRGGSFSPEAASQMRFAIHEVGKGSASIQSLSDSPLKAGTDIRKHSRRTKPTGKIKM